jgi:hypothetical protein
MGKYRIVPPRVRPWMRRAATVKATTVAVLAVA